MDRPRNSTQSWESSEMRMRRYTWFLIVGGAVLCSLATGFYWGNSRVGRDSTPAGGQYATLKLLDEYRRTGDPKKREAVEQASGESEILASRVFRAFRMLCFRPHSTEEKAFAGHVLSANTELSLVLLRLLFAERPDTDDGDRLFELDIMRSTYLGWCAGIAAIERDGVARGILEELSQHKDKDVASEAKSMLEHIRTNNYVSKSNAYKKLGRWGDLQWLKLRCLRKGMHRADIVEILGTPAFDDGILLAYHGKRDYPKGNYLWLSLLDTQLLTWEWGQSPSQEAAQRRRELQDILDNR